MSAPASPPLIASRPRSQHGSMVRTAHGRGVEQLSVARTQRERWLTAAAAVTREILVGDNGDPLAVVACTVAELAGAAVVTVVLPTHDARRLMIEVAAGADELIGLTYPLEGSLAGRATVTGSPVVHDASARRSPEDDQFSATQVFAGRPAGQVVAVPLIARHGARGALVIGRTLAAGRLGSLDVAMASMFADHASFAVELAEARENRHRLELLQDHARLAGDLHDHVVQRLFAVALTLDMVNADAVDRRIDTAVDTIRDTIVQLRATIGGLRGHTAAPTATLGNRVLHAIDEVSVLLPQAPEVSITGPLDELAVDDGLADDVVAVVRETLSNAGRHAGAEQVAVRIAVRGRRVTVEVIDDGAGIGSPERRSGLDSLCLRARRNAGEFTVQAARRDAVRPGTRARWTGRLP